MKACKKGAITVYFSVIFLSIVLVVMTMVDYSRINIAKVKAQRSLDIAVQSVLTEYDEEIKNNYGLFIYDDTGIGEKLNFYLDSNMTYETKKLTNQNIPISPSETEKQILQYMKYRAPLLVVRPFLEKLEGLVQAGNSAEAVQDVVTAGSTDKAGDIFTQIDETLNQLRYEVDGWKYDENNINKYIIKNKADGFVKQLEINTNYLFSPIQEKLEHKNSTIENSIRLMLDDTIDQELNNYLTYAIMYSDAYRYIEENKEDVKDLINDIENRAKDYNDKEEESVTDEIKKVLNKLDESISSVIELSEDIDEYNSKISISSSEEELIHEYAIQLNNLAQYALVVRVYANDLLRVDHYTEACENAVLIYDKLNSLTTQAIDLTNQQLADLEGKKDDMLIDVYHKLKQDLVDKLMMLEELTGQLSEDYVSIINNNITFLSDFRDNLYDSDVEYVLTLDSELKQIFQDKKEIVNSHVPSNDLFLDNLVFDRTTLPVIDELTIDDKVSIKKDIFDERYKVNFSFEPDYVLESEEAQDYLESQVKDDTNDSKNGKSSYDFKELVKSIQEISDQVLESFSIDPGEDIETVDARTTSEKVANFFGLSINDSKILSIFLKTEDENKAKNVERNKKIQEILPSTHYTNLDTSSLFSSENEGANTDNLNSAKGLKEEGKKLAGALDFFVNIGKLIEGKIIELRDDIYINEYIMYTFDCAASNKGDFEGERDLRNRPKEDNGHLLSYEVEYILSGNHKDIDNYLSVTSKITLMRFAANLLYIMTHHEHTIAASIAAIITAGVAAYLIPIVKFAIMAIWALAESALDLYYLVNGERIPLIKTADTFKLSFPGVIYFAADIGTKLSKKAVDKGIDAIEQLTVDKSSQILDKGQEYIEDKLGEYSQETKDKIMEVFASIDAEANAAKEYIFAALDNYIYEAIMAIADPDNYSVDTSELNSFLSGTGFSVGGINNIINNEIEKFLSNHDSSDKNLKDILVTTVIYQIQSSVKNEIDGLYTSLKSKIEKEANDKIDLFTENINQKIAELTESAKEQFQGQVDTIADEVQAKLHTRIDEISESTIENIEDSIIEKIDVKVTNAKVTKVENALGTITLSYKDYLRILLLLMDDETKCLRIMDLVQLNRDPEGEKLQILSTSTGIEVQAQVELDYLFIPAIIKNFTKGDLLNEDDHYYFTVQSIYTY